LLQRHIERDDKQRCTHTHDWASERRAYLCLPRVPCSESLVPAPRHDTIQILLIADPLDLCVCIRAYKHGHQHDVRHHRGKRPSSHSSLGFFSRTSWHSANSPQHTVTTCRLEHFSCPFRIKKRHFSGDTGEVEADGHTPACRALPGQSRNLTESRTGQPSCQRQRCSTGSDQPPSSNLAPLPVHGRQPLWFRSSSPPPCSHQRTMRTFHCDMEGSACGHGQRQLSKHTKRMDCEMITYLESPTAALDKGGGGSSREGKEGEERCAPCD
jgi:hypothetical protein